MAWRSPGACQAEEHQGVWSEAGGEGGQGRVDALQGARFEASPPFLSRWSLLLRLSSTRCSPSPAAAAASQQPPSLICKRIHC